MPAKFDIAVFGATGFTGRLAARTLAEDSGLRLVLAGRDGGKLEAVRKTCKNSPELFVADAHDAQRLRELVEQSRVILNFAGPFTRYAEPLIAACVALGRSYCDISGETVFIADMIAKYQAQALETKATLIPMAGFDSVPADVTSYLAVKEAKKRGLNLTRMDHFHKMRGGFNGGTLETTMNFGEDKITERFFDENVLIPDPQWPKTDSMIPGASYEPYLKAWTTPFFMHPTNAPLMRRSLYLAGEREMAELAYSERMVIGRGLFGWLGSVAMEQGLKLLFVLIDKTYGRKLIRALGPSPGQGPSERSQRNGFYSGTLIAREGDKNHFAVKMKAKGDPGNVITVLLATEVAQMLRKEEPMERGFTTATRAFGDRYLQALTSKGVALSVEAMP